MSRAKPFACQFSRSECGRHRRSTRADEIPLRFLVQLIGIGNFGDYPHRHLRRQAKLFAHGIVTSLMQIVLPEGFGLPSNIAQEVGRPIRRFKRLLEGFGLRLWSAAT